MHIYEKNIEVLKERFPYIVKSIEKMENISVDKIYIDKDIDEKKIYAIEKDGYLWYLNSRYHSEQMIKQWCEKHKRVHYFEPEIIFGLGAGEYFRAFRKENLENAVFIYEPDWALFIFMLHENDMTDIFEDENLYFAVGEEGIPHIAAWLSQVINYSNYQYCEFCILPGYASIYPYEYLLYKRAYMELFESLVLRKNTLINRANGMVKNELLNIKDIISQYSLVELLKKFQEKRGEMPDTAFLISAGPSLDKNIQDLKLIQGRAFIMAVDTAIRPLLQAGVTPDIFITIDAAKDIFLFQQEGVEKIPLIMNSDVASGVSQVHTGQHFYIMNGGNYALKYFNKYNKLCTSGGSGGSVATDAFAFLVRMGFSTIVLVGQDLAYPGNRSHAKAAYDDFVDPKTQKGHFFMVEDIYGEKVLTRLDMNCYRRWFETEIAKHKELRVIDATEGGAKIRGAEIKTLKEVIEQLNNDAYNFSEIIENIECVFDKKEQEEIEEDLKSFPEKIKETEEKLKEGKQIYERLDILNSQQKYQSMEFKKTYEAITAFNKWLNEERIVDLLSKLSHKEEYEVQQKAYSVKDDVYKDIKEISQQGIAVIEAYLEKVDFLMSLVQQILV